MTPRRLEVSLTTLSQTFFSWRTNPKISDSECAMRSSWNSIRSDVFFCSLAYQTCNEVIFEYLWYFVTFCLSFVTFSFRIGIGSSAADLSRPPIVRRQPRGHWGRTEANGGFNAKILIAKGRPSCSYPSSEHDVAKCSNLNVDDSGYHFIPLSQSYQNVLNTDFPILDVKLDKSLYATCENLHELCDGRSKNPINVG